MIRLILLLILLGGTAQAQTPMSGEEFDAYTRGKTLTFMESGQAYGIEQYLPGRRVTWAFDNGECQNGYWFEPEPAVICFLYEGTVNGEQCWNFFKTDTGLRAKFLGSEDGRELYEARRSRLPMLCLGLAFSASHLLPRVGVFGKKFG